jgi:hypothetical protein
MAEHDRLVPGTDELASEQPAPAPTYTRRFGVALAGLAAAGVVAFAGKTTLDSMKTKSKVTSLATQGVPFAKDAFAKSTKFVPSGDNWKSRADVIAMAERKPVYGDLDEDGMRAKFESFKVEHSRKYESSEEETTRFGNFKENLKYIDYLNKYNPLALFDVTESADYSSEERQQKRMAGHWADYENMKSKLPQDMVAAAARSPKEVLGKSFKAEPPKSTAEGLFPLSGKKEEKARRLMEQSQGEVAWASVTDCAACTRFPTFEQYSSSNRPTNFDWRALGAVTDIKNQKDCGSCWSFSTAQDIEGVHYLAGNDLISFAEQQLVACDVANDGCDGGWMYAAMQYVTATGGIVTDDVYPYKGVMMTYDLPTPTCDTSIINKALEADDTSTFGHIEGFQMVAMGAEYEDFMATFLVKNGPISIAVNANGMDYYIEGITGCETIAGEEYCEAGTIADYKPCDPKSLDHGVLITAYGEQDGVDYWMIKNSWSELWGDKGYYRMIRGSNECGVANMAQHSIYKQV